MPRPLSVLAVLAVVAASCQSLSLNETTTAEASSDRIVVSTINDAIVAYDPMGEVIARIDPPEGHVYRQPTWLDAETVVFSDVSDGGDHALVGFAVQDSSVAWRAEMDTPPFYFAPAPLGSAFGTTSLRNDPSGAGLIAELVDRSGEVTPLSNESPFYTSWSPSGEDLAVHIAGQRLDVENSGGTETILTETGIFQAPVWVERGLVTLRTISDTQTLALWDGDTFEDIAEIEGPAGFVARGNMIAVQAVQRPDAGSIAAGLLTQALPTVPGGRLVAIDLSNGVMQRVSGELTLVYQWDQKGESLLYAVLGDEPATLNWHVWSGGQSADIASFTVQPSWFTTMVPFFDQYAQSVQFWSPSGAYIGYPAIVESAPVVIVEPLDGSDPVIIPDATWSAWAPSG